jgi:hypothetical protein
MARGLLDLVGTRRAGLSNGIGLAIGLRFAAASKGQQSQRRRWSVS